jgi:diguanylate cyclase (GGDEF)-like protein
LNQSVGDGVAENVVAVLAVLVAIQYGFIGLYIVPRLARLAVHPGRGVVRAGQWGAALFLLGGGLTHVGIAVHTLTAPPLETGRLLAVDLWPNLAQIFGGVTFSYIAWRKLDIRFTPKGYEQERQRAQLERERAAILLAQRAAEQEAVAGLGQLALTATEPAWLLDEAVEVVTRTLGVDYCKVLEVLPSEDALRVTAGTGWTPGVVGHAIVPRGEGSQAGYTLDSQEPVIVADLRREPRFTGHHLLHAHQVVSGITVVIGGHQRPYGVLGVHTRSARSFSEQEINFLTSVANVLATAIDRAATERETQHRALHDPLTGLPNRALFLDRLEHALTSLERRPTSVAVLFLDLDNFKAVNDNFGHPAGDELLTALATRLQGALRSSETLARFGGDEFAVLCGDIDSADSAIRIARRLTDAVKPLFSIGGHEHFVSAGIGIAVTDSPAAHAEDLLRDADTALYRTKEDGHDPIELFDDQLRERALDRLRTETALRGAVERGEMRLVFQPQVAIADGSIIGVEALLRWDHPTDGVISPADFIPVAERTRLIIPIGEWVLRQACRQAAAWRREHPGTPVRVSVNVSAHQFAQPDFDTVVADALREAGARPDQLAIEITETALMQIAGSPLATLGRLRELGVHVQLDDFGTGYSSLGYIESLPLDALKMDRMFLSGLVDKPSSRAIFSAVIALGAALELPVIAEGVETDEDVEQLLALGCHRAQGYRFGRPTSPEAIGELLGAALTA